MYDAIIVGARCAGAATAMLLARRGHRVLLVDRASFPSDTISGHFILYPGVQKLAEWGLLDRVLATGCPPINRWATDFGDFTLAANIHTPDGLPASLGPRRTYLDKVLVDAAVEAGVELREGFTVTDVLSDGRRVTGVRGRTASGTMTEARGQLVIGADGKHSKIAELVQAPSYGEVPALTCWYMAYWSDFPSEGLEINWRPRRAVLALPTHDDLTLVAVGWPRDEFHPFRRDIDGNYRATLRLWPSLADRLAVARQAERYVGMADLPNYFRRPYGLGWALVGDAGHHKDPMLARGIMDAFCDADLLADAVHNGLSGARPMLEALAEYEERRNARAIPDNDLNLQAARLVDWDTPEVMGLRAALRHNPTDTERFLAARAKVIPYETFFNPANLGRIMQQAQERQPKPNTVPGRPGVEASAGLLEPV